MTTSRRNFLTKGTLVALAAGIPTGLAKVVSAAEKTTAGLQSGSALSKAAFAGQVNTEFVIQHGGNKVKTKLVNVVDLPEAAARSGKEGFSLLFRGDRKTPLKQETYMIEHRKLGKFSLLVVPAAHEDKTASFYEVVINRLYP